jgi:hypothetical protein
VEGIGPLQVVHENHERVFGPRQRADEFSNHVLQAPPRLVGAELRERRLAADDLLELWDQIEGDG